MNELMQSRGVRRPSVCPSVCKLLHACRYFYHKHDSIATKLAHDGPHMGDIPTSRVCSRSRSRWKITWYGHFSDYTKIATSTTSMTGSPPNLHTIVPIRARIQDVLKVNVKLKGHVIRTLLWCHEMFAIQYLQTFCLYMHSLYEAPLHSPSSISVRQLHVLSTSWNELLRHWRSSFIDIAGFLLKQRSHPILPEFWGWFSWTRSLTLGLRGANVVS